MKKENNIIKICGSMCFILCMICSVYTYPSMAQEMKSITFSKKLTREEAAAFKEPDNTYEDENGIRYQLLNWELEEKTGEEKKIPLEKQIRYLGLEEGEEIPETIYAEVPAPKPELPETESAETPSGESHLEETQPPLSGSLHQADIRIINEQWKDDLCLPVTFYSYGADEYQLGEITISAGTHNLLEETAQESHHILDCLGLSDQAYHITSMVWNGETFTDEEGQVCRNALALGERLLKDVEVTYKGEGTLKEPDYYELHTVYQAEEYEEESTIELIPQTPESLPDPAAKQGPFWYLIRTGFVITIAIGIFGILTCIILLLILNRRKKEEKDHL